MSNNFVPSADVRRLEKHKRQQVWHIRGKGELLLQYKRKEEKVVGVVGKKKEEANAREPHPFFSSSSSLNGSSGTRQQQHRQFVVFINFSRRLANYHLSSDTHKNKIENKTQKKNKTEAVRCFRSARSGRTCSKEIFIYCTVKPLQMLYYKRIEKKRNYLRNEKRNRYSTVCC